MTQTVICLGAHVFRWSASPVPQRSRTVAASARLGCAAAALVAQGLGSDHGAFDLAATDAFAENTPTLR